MEFINPGHHPFTYYYRMTRTQRRVMAMHLDNLAGLMAPHVSQTRRTVLGTRPREDITLALMASLSIN